jgi:hypothetical protein
MSASELLRLSKGEFASRRIMASINALSSHYPSTTVRHNIRHDIRHERPLNTREQINVARHTQDPHVHSVGIGLIRILRYPWLDNEAFYNSTSSSTWSKYESIAPLFQKQPVNVSASIMSDRPGLRLNCCKLCRCPTLTFIRKLRTRFFTPHHTSPIQC